LEENSMALVYEYMPEGTLQDKLRDNTRILTWKQRLRIAYESALGLEYLHKGCNPPLVHRDVKTNNILLNANLEAKIADFGLSRDFNMDGSSLISTTVVGTPGYLDPEYYTSFKLSQKSDVFSFGVVLLEIITGQPPIISGSQGGHVAQWVRKRLSKGNLDTIIDPRIQGHCDVNSVWKITDLACKCTEQVSAQRPTMNVVVTELRESLDLEIAAEETSSESTSQTYSSQNNYSRNNNFISDVSDNSIPEMAYLGQMPAPKPTAR
jgi:serine/threonine protein kinase